MKVTCPLTLCQKRLTQVLHLPGILIFPDGSITKRLAQFTLFPEWTTKSVSASSFLPRDLWGAAILNPDPIQARVFRLTCWGTCHYVAVIFQKKKRSKGLQNSFCTTNMLICCCDSHYCIKCFTRTWCKTLSNIHAFLTWLSSFLCDILQLLTFQFIFSQENNWLTFNTDTDPGKILLERRILK